MHASDHGVVVTRRTSKNASPAHTSQHCVKKEAKSLLVVFRASFPYIFHMLYTLLKLSISSTKERKKIIRSPENCMKYEAISLPIHSPCAVKSLRNELRRFLEIGPSNFSVIRPNTT